ncbi:hypothetical protein FORC2_p082 (plasmid) [Yersinia enterocolitica]|nr:hypothetical protein FORC2_p082 [Yersinia enterocolitica]
MRDLVAQSRKDEPKRKGKIKAQGVRARKFLSHPTHVNMLFPQTAPDKGLEC